MRPMFNLMLEAVAEFEEEVGRGRRHRAHERLDGIPRISDRLERFGPQIILGFAVPMTFADDATDAAAFVYFSYELPFK